MVMNPDSVCSSSLVLHRDSGWDCGTKAKADSDLGAQHGKGGHHHRRSTPQPCQSVSKALNKEQITVKVVVHQDNVPEKGGVSTFLVAALGSDCPRHSHAKPGQPVRPQPLTSGSEHPYGTGPGAASTASLLRPRDS